MNDYRVYASTIEDAAGLTLYRRTYKPLRNGLRLKADWTDGVRSDANGWLVCDSQWPTRPLYPIRLEKDLIFLSQFPEDEPVQREAIYKACENQALTIGAISELIKRSLPRTRQLVLQLIYQKRLRLEMPLRAAGSAEQSFRSVRPASAASS